MATLTGTDTYQRQITTNIAGRPDGQLVTGEVNYYQGTYTVTGSETTGDVIPAAYLPIGAIVIPALCRVSTDGTGGTSTAISKIGDAGDDDRYSATSITVASSASTAVTTTNAQAVTPWAIDTVANRTVLATITHSGAPTAGKKITFLIAFRMP